MFAPQVKKQKSSGHLPGIFAIISFSSAPKHLTHVHRCLFQHLVTHVGVDVRRGLVVRVANNKALRAEISKINAFYR